MIAVLTGDIIHSAQQPVENWLQPLKQFLGELGEEPSDWELYRGDEIQLRLQPQKAMWAAIRLKAFLISECALDIRIGLGLGEENFRAEKVSQSNGTAYRRSGQVFEKLRRGKSRFRINSGMPHADRGMNLILQLALHIMDNWSRVSAEAALLALGQPGASQTELARQLGIRQSAVSQRQSRARLDLINSLLTYYSEDYLTLLS